MKHTVLFVDDEENVIQGLRNGLRKQPYTILTATSGAGALELLEQHPVDVVVTDERMPGMTGMDLLQRVRAIRPQTIRVLLTGAANAQSMARALGDECVYRYLAKPLGAVELAATIQNALLLKDLRESAAALVEIAHHQNEVLTWLRDHHPDVLAAAPRGGERILTDSTRVEQLIAEMESTLAESAWVRSRA